MKKIISLLYLIASIAYTQSPWNDWIDANTVKENLKKAQQSHKSFFSQFHLYDARSKSNIHSSNYYEKTGEIPFIYALDFYYASGTYFNQSYTAKNRQNIIEIVKKQWQENKAIPSFSWHLENPYVPSNFGDYMGCRYRKSKDIPSYPEGHRFIIREILNNTGDSCGYGQYNNETNIPPTYRNPYDWFEDRLKEIASIISEFKDNQGKAIPIIFRIWHEMEDDWMWWGRKSCTAEEYKDFFKLTQKRITESAPQSQILWAFGLDRYWDKDFLLSRYPGDEFVDIIGYDDYSIGENDTNIKDFLKRAQFISDFAKDHNKIAALFETANIHAVSKNNFFQDYLLKIIQDNKVNLGIIQIWSTSNISTKAMVDDRINFLKHPQIIIKSLHKDFE
jgi:hypothetical protein